MSGFNRGAGIVAFLVFLCVPVLTFGGCASARLNKNATKPPTPTEQIARLESEAKEKDQQITMMQQEIAALRSSQPASYESSYSDPAVSRTVGATGALRVAGVTVEELQAALKNAGFNPGTIDGRLGTRTKDAIKRFQRKNGLQADGIVGLKTWSVLKRRISSSTD